MTASAHGSTVAFDTQETHHACMAMAWTIHAIEHAFCTQVVDPPGYNEPACTITAVWLPSFMMHRPMQGYGPVPIPTMTFCIPRIMFCHGCSGLTLVAMELVDVISVVDCQVWIKMESLLGYLYVPSLLQCSKTSEISCWSYPLWWNTTTWKSLLWRQIRCSDELTWGLLSAHLWLP